MYCFISQGMRRNKSKTITEPVLLKYSSNICLDYKISVLFKYILLITHPSTERFRDEFSAKDWTTTKPIKLAFSTPDSQHSHHCCAPGSHKPEPGLHKQSCPAPCLHSTVLHELLLFHSLQHFHCPSAAGTEGRCVLKCQAPWNTHTAEPHTKHWAVSCSLGMKGLFTAAS